MERKQPRTSFANDDAEFYRALVESLHDAVVFFDAETKLIIGCNDAFLSLYGYSKQELLLLKMTDVSADPQATSQSVEQTVAGTLDRIPIRYHRKKDGTVFPVEISASMLMRDGRALLCSVIRDISARIALEKELKKDEQTIRDALREKDILIKEIHHRVKNNLQIISSLLSLQIKFVHDDRDRELFNESHNRVYSMALAHEMLYQSKDLSRINFRNYIGELTQILFQSYAVDAERIRLYFNIQEIDLSIEKAIPCALIINELVSNALKYAFPGGRTGELLVTLSKTAPDRLELIVSDNGIGLPDSIDIASSNSLGMRLINALVEQVQGTVAFTNTAGTHCTITFPYQE